MEAIIQIKFDGFFCEQIDTLRANKMWLHFFLNIFLCDNLDRIQISMKYVLKGQVKHQNNKSISDKNDALIMAAILSVLSC